MPFYPNDPFFNGQQPKQLRRGSLYQVSQYVPAAGELVLSTDTTQLYVGDGTTVGGLLISGSGGTGTVYNQSLNTFNDVRFNTISANTATFGNGEVGNQALFVQGNINIQGYSSLDGTNINPGSEGLEVKDIRSSDYGDTNAVHIHSTLTISAYGIQFSDGSFQYTAGGGTGTVYNQSLNTTDSVVFEQVGITHPDSAGITYLRDNNGEFIINNLGQDMMTMNYDAQFYNDQPVGAVTFNAGRFGIANAMTGPMLEALPDNTTFYTPIIGNTATLQEIYVGSSSTYLHIYEANDGLSNNRINMDIVSPDGSVDGDLYITGNRYVDFSGPVAIQGALTVQTIESGEGDIPVQIINSLTVGAYTLGTSDGTAGQALITNGMGQVSFQTVVPSLDFGTFTSPAGFTLDMGRIV